MNRRRERGSLGRLFRENTKTFLDDILRHVGMIPDSVDQMLACMITWWCSQEMASVPGNGVKI